MAVTDDARRRLFTTLVGVLGEADAVSLMDERPPPGEGAVSKAHIDARFDAVDQRFDAVDQRFDAVERRLEAHTDQRCAEMQTYVADRLAKHTRVTVGATVAMNAATIGVVLTALGAA